MIDYRRGGIGLILGFAALIPEGCSSQSVSEGSTRQLRDALDAPPSASDILSFETPAGWSITQGTGSLGSSDDHSSGLHSLAVRDTDGFLVFASAPLASSSLGPVGSVVSLSIELPTDQPNPYWLGAVQLYAEIPSLNLFNAYVGQVELTGLPLGVFQTLQFNLPSAITAALNGSYSDLVFKIALNVPAGNQGTYLFDGMSTQAPTPATRPTPLGVPKPPAEMDCGWYTPRGWEAIPCATSAEIDALFPHPEYDPIAIRSQVFANSSGVNQTLPLLSAQLESTFVAVGPSGKVTDTPLAAPAANSGCKTGANTENKWSVQVNTNSFKASSGDNAAVQFAIQTKKLDDGSEINDVCVWNVDASKQDYSQKFCAIPPAKKRAGGFKQFDSSNVYAYADPTDNTLHVIAKMSWVEPGQPYIYTAKSPDVYGLIGKWTQVDGDVLGNGNCSSAVFEDGTELTNRMSASTCKDDTDATSSIASCPTPAFTPHATVLNTANTLETNNLQHVAPPTFPPTFANDDLAVTNWTESTTGQCVDAKHIYVSDRVGDTGSVPSNQGGEAFWESPDIFLVESGTPVDVNGFSTQANVTPGGSFDVYVRVHNDYGCADMTGAKARVYLADPSALSTPWQSITNGQYATGAADPNGVRVPAGKSALIGPFPFTASSTNLGDGHKCLIAAIIADNEAPVANDFDAPNSNQVAQRNVQFGDICDYPLTNATPSADTVKLTLTATPPEQHPSLTQPPALEVSFDDPNSNWFNVWAAQPNNGTDFSLSKAAGKTKVRLGTNQVTLAPVPIAPGETRDSSSTLDLPLGAPLTTLQLQAALGSGAVLNGESCQIPGGKNPL